jgi:hypothetical protein
MKADVKSALDYMKSRNYPNPTAERILAIAYAESSATIKKVSQPNFNGTRDYGFMQINSVHFNEPTFKSRGWNAQTMLELGPNIDAAGFLSNGWKNWKPWVTFNTGAYLLFIPQAKKDMTDYGSDGILPDWVPGSGGVNAVAEDVQATSRFLSLLSQPGTWLRVGYGVLGILLIGVAVQQLAPKAVPTAAVTKIVKGAL